MKGLILNKKCSDLMNEILIAYYVNIYLLNKNEKHS